MASALVEVTDLAASPASDHQVRRCDESLCLCQLIFSQPLDLLRSPSRRNDSSKLALHRRLAFPPSGLQVRVSFRFLVMLCSGVLTRAKMDYHD